MTTPNQTEHDPHFQKILKDADLLAERYGYAIDSRSIATDLVAKVVSTVEVVLAGIDMKTTREMALVEDQRRQHVDGAVPMIED